jgi:hypothetical protein
MGEFDAHHVSDSRLWAKDQALHTQLILFHTVDALTCDLTGVIVIRNFGYISIIRTCELPVESNEPFGRSGAPRLSVRISCTGFIRLTLAQTDGNCSARPDSAQPIEAKDQKCLSILWNKIGWRVTFIATP